MDFPGHLMYSKEHEWVLLEKNETTIIGITEFAVKQLGDIVFLELPEVGEEFEVGSVIGTIESTKAVSDIFIPIGGEIIEVNNSILSSPEIVEKEPYKEGWLIKMKPSDLDEVGSLMDADTYEGFVKEF